MPDGYTQNQNTYPNPLGYLPKAPAASSCTYNPCKLLHCCQLCKGLHLKFMCPRNTFPTSQSGPQPVVKHESSLPSKLSHFERQFASVPGLESSYRRRLITDEIGIAVFLSVQEPKKRSNTVISLLKNAASTATDVLTSTADPIDTEQADMPLEMDAPVMDNSTIPKANDFACQAESILADYSKCTDL
eukprot:gene7378-13119_t